MVETTTPDPDGAVPDRAVTTAVLGLGNIGGAVAERLVATGEPVVGVDPVEAARLAFTERTGATAVADVEDLALADGARVLVVVRLAAEALAVLDRLAERDERVVAFVLTTLDLDAAARLAEPRAGVRVVELPVSGGRQGALDGTLTALAAGPLEDADRSFLERTVAGRVVGFAEYGHPTAAKLHNNVLAGLHAVAHARVLEAAASHGLDPVLLDEVIAHGSGASWMGTNLRVVVDDLLAKDIELYEQCFGRLDPLTLGADGGEHVATVLARVRARLTSGRS